LLWQKRDVGLLTYFVEQLADEEEKRRAWQRYHEIRNFVEAKRCRHHQICAHFGEIRKWNSCGACDVCVGEPGWLSAPAPATRLKKRKAAAAAAGASGAASVRRAFQAQGIERSATLIPLGDSRASSLAAGIDPDLREYLREWRRTIAKERGTAAFIVMHDTSLDELCRVRPRSLGEIRSISGFGERKTELYGQGILDALEKFRGGARASEVPEETTKPAEETARLLAEGRNFEEIAKTRGRLLSSVVSLVVGMMERGEVEFQERWVDAEKQAKIEEACARLGIERLKPLKDALPAEITFEEIKLVVARLRIESETETENAASGES
jgi:ATP-dependent DNA helicase RecQ